jgi:hypothetical protein
MRTAPDRSSRIIRRAQGHDQTHGTLFHGKRMAVELIVHVLACLAEDFLPFVNFNLSNFYLICTSGSRRYRVTS